MFLAFSMTDTHANAVKLLSPESCTIKSPVAISVQQIKLLLLLMGLVPKSSDLLLIPNLPTHSKLRTHIDLLP